jgi:hypothetical protein
MGESRTISAASIYDEARAARTGTETILERLSALPGEEDPLAELLAALAEIVRTQGLILRRLDAIERKLDARPPSSGAR